MNELCHRMPPGMTNIVAVGLLGMLPLQCSSTVPDDGDPIKVQVTVRIELSETGRPLIFQKI